TRLQGDWSSDVCSSDLNQGKELAGLKALVTGSTGGIGRAIALELAAAGADVIIHGRRTAAAEKVADQVAALGVNANVKLNDLMRSEERRVGKEGRCSGM